MNPSLQSGYAYEYTGKNWRTSSSEPWDTVVVTPTGKEKFLGYREIDGSQMGVWKLGRKHYAQLVFGRTSNPFSWQRLSNPWGCGCG